MKKMISKVGIILLALLMTNCAAIIHGNKQTVDFSSQPSGANKIGFKKQLSPKYRQ
jgi:hypothetical protein